MDLKRLWDTENKKNVRAVNKDTNKEYQVWTNDDGSKLYIYDIEWKELSASLDVCEYWPVWKELEDETVGYYLTNKPTDLYNWDEWDEVSYRFMNWTTVLDSWKIDEWETPEYTGDTPTKAADAHYTYTFSGWKPTVGPIYKKTDFKAQFDKTVNKYTISIAANDGDYGTVSESSLTNVPYGTKISIDEETGALVIGEWETATTVTGTPAEWYGLVNWTDDLGEALPAALGGALSVVAVFEQLI